MDCCWGWVLSLCFTPPTSSLHGIIISHQKCFSTFSPLLQGLGAVSLSLVEELPCFLITCPQYGASEVESLYFFIFILSAVVAQSVCAAMFYWLCLLFKFVFYRCGGTVGAIFTCPLEVIKTRLQSSKLAFRAVYYPQVQLGTISGEGMVRPTSVSPGLFSVLKWVVYLWSFDVNWHQRSEFQFLSANRQCRFCFSFALEGRRSVGLLHSAVER